MKMKIINIKGCKTCKQVLLYIGRPEEGDCVFIVAWHLHEDCPYIQEASVEFSGDNEIEQMERFIIDYSECSANEFANSMNF